MTMASGNFSSNTGTNLNLYITWSSTTNVGTNTSSVTVNVYSRSYTINGSALADSYVTVNGNTKSLAGISLSQSVSNLTDKLLTTYTVSVPHNPDGTKSITIKANIEFNGTVSGKYLSDITASKTVDLDTIPRSSSLSVPTSVNTGSSLTSTITPSSSSFAHKIAFIIDGSVKYTSGFINPGTNTFAYTIPHSWLPSVVSVQMTVRLYTYTSTSATTAIGQIDKTLTVNVPASIRPTVSALTASIVDGLGGYYVEGKSKVKLTATATAGSGSTLSSYVFSGANINGNSTSYTGTSATVTSGVIKTDGMVTYSVIAKDTRPGRESDAKTTSITVYPYAQPQITSVTAQRCLADGTLDSNGTYAKVIIKTSHSSVNGANKRVLTLYSSKDNYASGTVVLAATNTDNTYIGVYGSGFTATSSYTIRAVITGSYNTGATIQKSTVLKVAERTINIAKYGNGVSIGGLSTVTNATDSGLFEVNWSTKIIGTVSATGNIATTGSFGNTNTYSAGNFAIYCPWADSTNHDLLVRSSDGLTVGLGWVGSDTYTTKLDIRPKQVSIRGETTIQGFRVPEVQRGSVDITPSAANTPTSKIIAYPKAFSDVPIIVTNPLTSVPGTTILGVSANGISTTQASIYLTRTNTVTTTIYWLAVN